MSLTRLCKIGVFLPLMLSACDSDPCGNDRVAAAKAAMFVKGKLQHPATANFKPARVERDGITCYYKVSGEVVSNNAVSRPTVYYYKVILVREPNQDFWDPWEVQVY